jgi:hypothetical protein
MTIETSARVTPNPSATELLQRDVSDKIRNLTPASAKLLTLVAQGKMEDGKMVKSAKGFISKRSTKSLRVEGFTYTPLPATRTVSSVNGLDLTMSSAETMTARQVWLNTNNNTTGIVDTVSGSVVTFVTVGSTTFSASASDTLQYLGTAYEEGSSNPFVLGKTDDNYYNLCQTFRFAMEIANEAKPNPQLAGGNLHMRMRENNMIYALQSMESAIIWGNRSASGNKTTITTPSVSVATMQGLWNWAGATYDFAGNATPSKFRNNMAMAFDDSVSSDKDLIMLTSKQVNALMLEWPNDKLQVEQSNDSVLNKFGVKTTKYITAQNTIEVITHDSFNKGANTNKAIIFAPNDLQYVYLEGQDIRPNFDIQNPSSFTSKDEITGVISILPLDGGKGITKITNIF